MGSFRAQSAITFHHPYAFWAGTVAVVAGVCAHVPMFLSAAEMNFHMAGMAMSLPMTVGMYAIVIGTLVVAYGLIPAPRSRTGLRTSALSVALHVRALDDSRLTAAHWKLIAVLSLALIVDVMKPATLGFVIPGTAQEYGLTKSQVALLPLAGITGTTVGSLVWGYLGDVIGRRASILLAAMIFIGTAICGAMPSYGWNVFMCFVMGLGAGGMLPIGFALLAEIIPARQRGWMVVLIGGIATVGGYLAASGSAALLEPFFGWRIMWFLGLPTGVLLILLNRYIPESPRYLMVHGDEAEAKRVMAHFGVKLVHGSAPSGPTTMPSNDVRPGNLSELFKRPYASLTAALSLYALAWGLVNFGFLLWLPSNLRSMGMGVAASDAILAKSALIAFPATILVAWLYHTWSTKRTMVLFALLTVLSLAGFVIVGDGLTSHTVVLGILLVGLLVSSSGVVAMLSPYTAEVYPSHIRATGSGWTAGCSKGAGGMVLGAALAGLTPGIAVAAIVATVPSLAAAAMLIRKGVETRGRNLEDIQEVELRVV